MSDKKKEIIRNLSNTIKKATSEGNSEYASSVNKSKSSHANANIAEGVTSAKNRTMTPINKPTARRVSPDVAREAFSRRDFTGTSSQARMLGNALNAEKTKKTLSNNSKGRFTK